MAYGKELILDLHGCNQPALNRRFLTLYRRRKFLRGFFNSLCRAIKMDTEKLAFWDDFWTLPWNRQTRIQTKGTSAVQFIITSNITLHYLELTESVYINIFTCKDFNREIAERIVKIWFKPETCNSRFIERI